MSRRRFLVTVAATALVTAALTALLVSIFERKQEGRERFVRVVDISEWEPDPAVWGRNFPREYSAYLKTVRTEELAEYSPYGRYGGSEAFSKLDRHPDYRRLFAGYAFSVEYNEERGHMKALEDVLATQRLGDAKPGTCMTCKSSQVPGLMAEMGPDAFYSTPMKRLVEARDLRHSISCVDCHEPESMGLRISRPAFREAMERRGVDLARATRQEMRTFVCAQCHVEYYFEGSGKRLRFPWDNGLGIDDIGAYYEEKGFKDWTHGESGADMIKVQHPEFELWSTGVHARARVSCADCHMPYVREGAVKITDHWIRSPLMNLSNACLTCHRESEREMRDRVVQIQDRTHGLLQRAEAAILASVDEIKAAREAGASDEALAEARGFHRRAQLRWDFVSAENSMGFHSPQEAARILGDAIDLARQGQIAALKAPR